MASADIIDSVLPHAPKGYSRHTGSLSLLKLIEQAQDKLFDYDSPYMRYLGTDNQGWPPYLKTVAGTYRYAINATNLASGVLAKTIGGTQYNVRCRQVLKVFLDSSNVDYNLRWLGAPYIYSFQNPYATPISRVEVRDVKVQSSPALENTEAYIDFPEDPGESEDKYFVEFLWEPMRLTTEDIPLCVPKKYEEGIEEWVMGTIQKRIERRTNEFIQRFEQYWVSEFRREMFTGAQVQNNETMMRYC